MATHEHSQDKAARGTCRDFERGVCNRGSTCKFYHPDGGVDMKSEQKLPICKDYQNKGCDRGKCKFLHITPAEEADYNRSGLLPDHGGHPTGNTDGGKAPNDVCRDFLNGICNRGNNCKFRHVSENSYQMERGQMERGPMGGGMYGKRRRDEYDSGTNDSPLVEENEMLRRKVTDLQRQVIDLRQMNDTLYDQNTRYRNQLRGAAAPASADPYAKPISYPPVAPVDTMQPTRTSYDGYTTF